VESIDYNNFIQLCLIPTKRIYPLPVGEISPSVYETRLASCRKKQRNTGCLTLTISLKFTNCKHGKRTGWWRE